MPKFIELHFAEGENPYFLAIDKIVSISDYTVYVVDDGSGYYHCIETAEEILQKIKECEEQKNV